MTLPVKNSHLMIVIFKKITLTLNTASDQTRRVPPMRLVVMFALSYCRFPRRRTKRLPRATDARPLSVVEWGTELLLISLVFARARLYVRSAAGSPN